MSKKARHESRMTDKQKYPKLYKYQKNPVEVPEL